MSRSRTVPIRQTFTPYLTDKGEGSDSEDGSYRSDAERELRRFHRWANGKSADGANADPAEAWTGVTTDDTVRFSDLDTRVFRRYARYLTGRGWQPNTVITYYAHVAAWCGWCHDEGYLDRHHARESRAEAPLPDTDGRRPGDQQFWTPADRDALLRHCDRVVDDGLETLATVDVPPGADDPADHEAVREKLRARMNVVRAIRDRSLVAVLAYTGVRGAEVFDYPESDVDGRNGVRWADVDLEQRSMTVYRKTGTWEEVAVPAPVLEPLARYRGVLAPPTDWRVFTTLHRPTLARHVTDELKAAGHDSDGVAELRENYPDLLLAAERGLDSPPALTTHGARRVMERLCDEAEIEIEDADYLQPHGGRRGVGEVLFRKRSATAAARQLGNSPETVRRTYEHIEAREQAQETTEALAETDDRVDDG